MGINIIGINQTNIIQIAIYITSFVFSQFPLPNYLPVLVASFLIQILKHRRFLMRVLRLSLCKQHSSRTGYHSNIEWLMYQRKTSHKSTGQFFNSKAILLATINLTLESTCGSAFRTGMQNNDYTMLFGISVV